MCFHSALFSDFKENRVDTESTLTAGLEDIEPDIKQISTRPTGVDVRGRPSNNNNGGDSFVPENGKSVASDGCSVGPLFSVLFVSLVLVYLIV